MDIGDTRFLRGAGPHKTHREKASVGGNHIDPLGFKEAADSVGTAQGGVADYFCDRQMADTGKHLHFTVLADRPLRVQSQHPHLMAQLGELISQVECVHLYAAQTRRVGVQHHCETH